MGGHAVSIEGSRSVRHKLKQARDKPGHLNQIKVTFWVPNLWDVEEKIF